MENSMPSSALATISEPPDSSIDRLVRERLVRLAELIRKDGAPYPLTPQLVNVWVDVFARANVTAAHAEAAFAKAERHIKFWPSPAEVLGFISIAEKAAEEAAAQKWNAVREYIRLYYNPDIPPKSAPRISQRTMRAINAAGGLAYLSNCDRESLQWARKSFIEAYLRYGELQQDEYLLPAGEVRDLLEASAEQKELPGEDAYGASRANGERYRGRLGEYSAVVRQLAASPKKAESRPAITTSERLELLERQRAELLAKCTRDEIRRAEQLRARCAGTQAR